MNNRNLEADYAAYAARVAALEDPDVILRIVRATREVERMENAAFLKGLSEAAKIAERCRCDGDTDYGDGFNDGSQEVKRRIDVLIAAKLEETG